MKGKKIQESGENSLAENLNGSQNIMRTVKKSRIRWAGQIEYVREQERYRQCFDRKPLKKYFTRKAWAFVGD
jgi:hypothetical protein